MNRTNETSASPATVTTAVSVLTSLLQGDPTISPERRAKAESALKAILSGQIEAEAGTDADRVLSRAEAAKMLHCTTRYVSRLGMEGKIRRVTTGGERALGFSAKSIERFING